MLCSIDKKLIYVLEQNGVYISSDWDDALDFDSITFISTIVCIEDEFELEIPDELLQFENFNTFRLFVENISKIISECEK